MRIAKAAGCGCLLLLSALYPAAWAKDAAAHPLSSIPVRELGPALTSGRISDFAFHPQRKHEFYVATAAGGLWKTTNNTLTWTPLFDEQPSSSIGVVELDPNDPLTVWVGTGENNAQRSVGYGDGVYKSVDGGVSWTQMGLKDSGHISQIWIDPADSRHVLVAAQGPLWSDGGDRGLYRSRDGGKSWKRILEIDKYTGVNEFVVDPRNSDRIVASTYQRRRHVWVLINGGPGSGIHRSSDGGESWTKIENGLPKGDLGRIGLAAAPSAPDRIYAIIEADDEHKGVYHSADFGVNWEKRSAHMTSSPQYYNELVVDPKNPERLYSPDTFTHVSEDGGRSFNKISFQHRHVDDHALWIDPDNSDHLYIGGDGGVYESWDRGNTWRHVQNLPITQFYRIQPDNAEPFYNVCGGTQDNNSLCAPSRTPVIHGITNADWTIVVSGDGYKPQFDPRDPNIIYAQYQYGGLARYDRRTMERVYIAPHPGPDEQAYNWNWNTPLLLSPHAPERLYYGAERLYRSDDRGDSWTPVSPNLTRQVDRNTLEVMGRVWSVDAIAKNDSTSRYGSLIGLTESPLVEGLIYAGSDDGVINVSEDGGQNWRAQSRFRGVPEHAYVDDLVASVHSADVAYAVIDNHKRGDFKPYVMKTENRGKSWRLISGDLPTSGPAHSIAEDHVDPKLLFLGTESGVHFSQDGGKHWHPLEGLPTVAVRDIEIQRREHDLVIGTFGRGIWILDDYRPLRADAKALEKAEASLFPVRDAWMYIEGDRWDDRERGSNGAGFYRADNPGYGAVFNYYLPEAIEPAAKQRRAAEAEVQKKGGDTPYPSWDALRAEDQEEAPSVLLIVRDAQGEEVRRIAGASAKGFQSVSWDMRLPPPDPVNLEPPKRADVPYWLSPPMGPLALPGSYSVQLAVRIKGQLQEIGAAQPFVVKLLPSSPEITEDRKALLAYQLRSSEMLRQLNVMAGVVEGMDTRIAHLKGALILTTKAGEDQEQALRRIEADLFELKRTLSGDTTVTSRNEAAPWSINDRVTAVFYGQIESQSMPPKLYQDSIVIAEQQMAAARSVLVSLESRLSQLERALDAQGAPWTPGRKPEAAH